MDMPESSPAIREQLFHGIKQVRNATIILFLSIVLVFGYGFWQSAEQRETLDHEVERIDSALCTFVLDLERRVEAAREFLQKHPDGIEGIPAGAIRTSIDNQKKTIDALSGLRCHERQAA